MSIEIDQEPTRIGTVIKANRLVDPGVTLTFTRYSHDTVGSPWMDQHGYDADWAELDNMRFEDGTISATDFANISFQMGLATGQLIKEGRTDMPLEWVYRLMSGENFGVIEAERETERKLSN